MASKSQVLRKEQIMSVWMETRQEFLAEVSNLSKEQCEQVFLGIWSVKDVLAHVIGWDFTNLDAMKSVQAGQVPAFYEHKDRDWQAYNAMLVKKHKKGSMESLLASVKTSQNKLMQFLKAVPPDQFNKDFGVRFRGYKVTIQRLLEADTKDVQVHLQQIVDFFKVST
jgi:hypothetical protein